MRLKRDEYARHVIDWHYTKETRIERTVNVAKPHLGRLDVGVQFRDVGSVA